MSKDKNTSQSSKTAGVATAKKSSIRKKIMIPVITLGVVSIISNIMAISNLNSVNDTALVISDEYMNGVEVLSKVQNYTELVHNQALSHIIATDFETMISIVSDIEEDEATLEDYIDQYGKYVEDDNKDYTSLKSNYKAFVNANRELMAFSADQNTSLAYAKANGDVSDCADAMEKNINALNEDIVVGADEAKNDLTTVFKTAIVSNIIIMIIAVASVILAIAIVMRSVIGPLVRAQKEIDSIIKDIENAEGDLTKRITITSNDEIAALGNGINSFMTTLQKIFSMITTNSGKMEQVVTEVLGSVRTSNESASDLSAVTEELSATMQEVANSANVINNNTNSVSEEVNNISEKSTELNEYSKNMKQHADHMEHSARENMEETNSKVNEILEVLGKAIEDAKSVDQVNALTNDILNISSQTNLLALNASIEAARAGEAGKGFAVVASEISQLADSSRDAANHIQKINQIVTDAVHNLSDHANSLVEFMQQSILPEFEEFVNEGVQYKDNATYIENSMEEFNKKTDNLRVVMTEIADSIRAITSAIDEGVNGVSGAAESTQALVYDMDNITERMGENEKIAGELQKETAIFKNL